MKVERIFIEQSKQFQPFELRITLENESDLGAFQECFHIGYDHLSSYSLCISSLGDILRDEIDKYK